MTQYQTIVNMISIIKFLSPGSAAVCHMISRCEVLSSIHFCQTSSVFSDPLDLLDHPLLLDIFSLGAPQLRTGLGFLFFFKVSFEKHPSTGALLCEIMHSAQVGEVGAVWWMRPIMQKCAAVSPPTPLFLPFVLPKFSFLIFSSSLFERYSTACDFGRWAGRLPNH